MIKLILKNRIGESYDLLNSSIITFQLDGLGLSGSSTYVKAGSDYLLADEFMEQRVIEFTAIFHQDADATYKAFVIFARKNPLTLVYKNDSGEYEIHCDLQSISRIDRKGYQIFGCSVSLICTSNFFQRKSAYNEGRTGEATTYPYTYSYTYSEGVAESVEILSDTVEDSPCKIMIYGPCEDPTWRHYVNGELYAVGTMIGSIPSNRVLVIDSTVIPYSITEQDMDGNLTADRYQSCDFGTERFFFLRNGRNIITVTHTDTGICPIKVEANISYASI